MVDARVAHHKVVDLENFARAQERPDDSLSPVSKSPKRRAAGVDQEYFGTGKFNHRGVALSDVEMSDAQFVAILALAPPIDAVGAESISERRDQRTNGISIGLSAKQQGNETVEQRDFEEIRRRHADIGQR